MPAVPRASREAAAKRDSNQIHGPMATETIPKVPKSSVSWWLGLVFLTCDERVLPEVTWKDEPKEDGKSQHKEVPGRI